MPSMSTPLKAVFEKTKTICFGRFTLEVPITAAVIFGPAEVGPEISYLPDEGGQIAQYVESDLQDIETSRKYFDKEDIARLPHFGKVIEGVLPGQKIVFDSKDRVGYYINSYVSVGKDLFVMNYGSVLHQDYDLDEFNTLAANLRLLADEEVPEEPGTCIGRGFLSMELDYERVRIGVRLQEFPDVHLSIDVHKNRERLEESGRLERMLEQGEQLAKAQGHGAAYARIKTLRRGARELGPWKGFEMLARKPAYNDDTEAHEFYFHSLGAVNDSLRPQLDVRLNSGVKNNRTASIKPSLTDEEAIALWDKLIGTIRVRETGNAKPSADPAKEPLGKLTATGNPCTQQGWWQCMEGDNVEGGKRRHFKQGELMPHAILLGEPNFWQKLTGDRPRHKTATVWQLTDYDDLISAPMLPEGDSVSANIADTQTSAMAATGSPVGTAPRES